MQPNVSTTIVLLAVAVYRYQTVFCGLLSPHRFGSVLSMVAEEISAESENGILPITITFALEKLSFGGGSAAVAVPTRIVAPRNAKDTSASFRIPIEDCGANVYPSGCAHRRCNASINRADLREINLDRAKIWRDLGSACS